GGAELGTVPEMTVQTLRKSVCISTMYLVMGSAWSGGRRQSRVAFRSEHVIDSIDGQRGTSNTKENASVRDRRPHSKKRLKFHAPYVIWPSQARCRAPCPHAPRLNS